MGYPEWWDHSRDSRKKNSKKAYTVVIVETKTEDDSGEKSSALAAPAGNGGKVLNISTLVSNSAWIIDFGATDHMTFDRQVSPLQSSSQNFVSTTNGTSISIIGEGSLSLTNTLNLDSVLVVPSLNYNLLSVYQINTALFCIVIFWPEFCVFKDIRTRQMIGCGVRRGKLYYLDLVSKSSDELCQALKIGSSEKK